MKTSLKYKNTLVAFALLCVAWGSAALTLGRAQGVALVGRPLELAIYLQLEGGEAPALACFEVEVFYADTRQNPARIHIAAGGSLRPQTDRLRIISDVPVDEPVVTVYLRAICGEKISRHYVLLAELADDLTTPTLSPTQLTGTALTSMAPAAGGARSAVTAGSSRPAQSPAGARSATPASPVAAQGVASPPTRKPAEIERQMAGARPDQTRTHGASGAPAQVKAVGPTRRLPVPDAGRARLQLDLVDLFELPDSTLMISSELLSRPTENPQRRLEAAAMWRAVNATPQEILHAGDRVQDLQEDVRALKAITASNQSGLTDLEARLQKAQSQRYANPVVYLLVALLVASLLALLMQWRRRRGDDEPNWWRDSGFNDANPETAFAPEAGEAGKSDRSRQASKSIADDGLAAPSPDLDIDISMPDVVAGKAPKRPG